MVSDKQNLVKLWSLINKISNTKLLRPVFPPENQNDRKIQAENH